MEHRRENLVFAGQDWQKLRFVPSSQHPIRLRGPQSEPSEPVEYIEDEDFVVDYDAGAIKRTGNSRIPDWRKHESYGLDLFDHREFSSYSNSSFTCEVEYTAEAGIVETENGEAAYIAELRNAAWAGENAPDSLSLMEQALPRLYKKLLQDEPVHYVVYGDSISAGYEASCPERDYPLRFADAIRAQHSSSDVYVHRKALAGDTSRGGLQRLVEDVLPIKPDLITIGYGMNDQTQMVDGSNALSVDEFEQNLLEMVRLIREQSAAEVILLTPCLPNPRWIFASSNVTDYADAIRRAGRAAAIPVADVQRIWLEELAAGKTHESLLLNNLNHPNDYGHSLYFAALKPFVTVPTALISGKDER